MPMMGDYLSRFLKCFADCLDQGEMKVAHLHAGRLRALDTCLPDRILSASPTRVPVQALCEEELAASVQPSPLSAAVLDLLPFMHLTRSPAYLARPPSEHFATHHGYGVICGPGSGPAALMHDADISFGVLLLGPKTHYPLHHHPADELYHVVSGASDWLKGEEAWTLRNPGDNIHHPAWVPHATRTLNSALVALYIWQGDLETDAAFLPDPGTNAGPSAENS